MGFSFHVNNVQFSHIRSAELKSQPYPRRPWSRTQGMRQGIASHRLSRSRKNQKTKWRWVFSILWFSVPQLFWFSSSHLAWGCRWRDLRYVYQIPYIPSPSTRLPSPLTWNIPSRLAWHSCLVSANLWLWPRVELCCLFWSELSKRKCISL